MDRRAFPAVRLIANPENAGFSKANNLGARESRGRVSSFLEHGHGRPPGSIGGPSGEAQSRPVRRRRRPGAAPRARILPGLVRRKSEFRGPALAEARPESVLQGPPEKRRKGSSVGWLSAACLLCRREAFEQAGGFDERFFIYFEDIDLCYRFRKAGWKLIHVPAVRIFHEGGATTAPRAAASRFEYRKSQLYFYRKNTIRATSSRFLRPIFSVECPLDGRPRRRSGLKTGRA